MPVRRPVDKKAMVHLYNGIPLSDKKILPFVTAWMDLDSIMLSEINQTKKGKYI